MTVKEICEVSTLSEEALSLLQQDSTSSAYLDSLEKQELYQDAIRFLAHKLPTDAGVKWAAGCARELQAPAGKDQKDESLEASECWIQTPSDTTRWAAKVATDKPESAGASMLLAMAVFMSGGSLAPAGAPEVAPPPYSAQKLIAGSILVTVVSHEPHKAKERYKQALTMGKELDVAGIGH
jgi:hypothetical protein